MHFRFFNTYDTAAPFFRNLVPFLAAQGHQVDVIVSQTEYRSGYKLSQSIGQINNVNVIAMSHLGLQPKNFLSKLVIMIAYLSQTIFYTLFTKKVDQNIFLTQPPLIALLGYLLLKLRGQSYYCVIMDIYPNFAIELGMMSRTSLWTKLLDRLSKLSLCHAKGIIATGRCMVTQLKTMGIRPCKIHFVPNWADETVIYPVDHVENKLRIDQGWQDKTAILFAGNIGIPQYFDDILKVAEMLRERPDIVFVFIGEGFCKRQIAEYITNHKLTNVLIYPFLHDQYPLSHILGAGDIHLVLLKESCNGLAIPSKTYAALAAARPLIYQGNKSGEVAQMVSEEEMGFAVSCGDVEGLQQAILRYVDQPELMQQHGERAFALSRGKYSRQNSLQQYAEILCQQNELSNASSTLYFQKT